MNSESRGADGGRGAPVSERGRKASLREVAVSRHKLRAHSDE